MITALLSSLLVSLASSAEIFNLQDPRFRSLNSRIPNSCSTQSGSSCVFPFSYKGVTHYQCTYTDSPVPWCATQTNTDGSVVTNSWGDCQISSTSSCTSETLTITPCTTTSGSSCQFPFRYQGVVYTECATVDQSGPWCSTSVTAGGEHIAGSEGFCPSTCPVVGGGSGGSSSPCTPGSSFTVDCNTCVCNSLGQAVCTTNTCTGTTTTTTTTTTTSTTSTSTTTTTTTASPSSSCVVSSGPATGQTCVFPFTFNGVTHNTCADWIYGGQPTGTRWCSTMVDSAGVHVNGQGHYGFCPSTCPGLQPQSINLLTRSTNTGAVRFGGARGPK